MEARGKAELVPLLGAAEASGAAAAASPPGAFHVP
jgi:hypothetical protein